MNKKLDEAWTTICHYNEEIIHDMGSEYVENPLKEEIDIVNNALLELKAIKEAKPSEALKELERIKNQLFEYFKSTEVRDGDIEDYEKLIFEPIKQALLKAQEQEKENAELRKILSIVKEKRIDLESFYITFIEKEYHYNYYKIMYGTYGKFKLTEEEFDLLKRCLG